MDGELVMMSVTQGKYFSIGQSGVAIWRLLDQKRTVTELVHLLQEQYEVDEKTCRSQMNNHVRPSIIELLQFAEAYLLLGIVRACVVFLPFRHVAPLLGREGEEVSSSRGGMRQDIKRAIERSAHRTPWRSKCLAQSLTATWMMSRRGHHVTTYLGVRRDESGAIIAHSWTIAGETFMTGKRGYELYTVTKVFSAMG